MLEEWGLVPEDDGYHAPPDAQPWWTETTWFSWMVPERKVMGHWYFVMRANVGVQFGGVCVFDDAAVLPWELPSYDWDWHEPLPEPHDLRDMKGVLRGMSLKCLEPGRRYRIGHDGEDLSLDLEFEVSWNLVAGPTNTSAPCVKVEEEDLSMAERP